jgi:hypothetical protein
MKSIGKTYVIFRTGFLAGCELLNFKIQVGIFEPGGKI